MSFTLYNTTPFKLCVYVCDCLQRRWVYGPTVNVPSNGRLISIVDQAQDHRLLVLIMAADPRNKPLRYVSYFSSRGHSWIIGDSEVRRQRVGADYYVADQYTSDETEAHFRPLHEKYKWIYGSVIKQYEWRTKWNVDVCLYVDDTVSSSPEQLTFLKQLYRYASERRASAQPHSDRFDGGSPTACIFNDTPYHLDIYVHAAETSEWYWNDPTSGGGGGGRTVEIRSTVDPMLVVINAVDDIGRRVKFVAFFTRGEQSWIVNDDCVVRRRPGSADYVADDYVESETDARLSSGCKTPGHDLKVHCWLRGNSGASPPVVHAGDFVVAADAEAASAAAAAAFFDDNWSADFAIHPLMRPDERFQATALLEWMSFARLSRNTSPTWLVVLRARNRNDVKTFAAKTYKVDTTVASSEHGGVNAAEMMPRFLDRMSGFRIAGMLMCGGAYRVIYVWHLRPQDAKMVIDSFAVVFVHRDVSGMTDEQFRLAFHMSINYACSVGVSQDDGLREPLEPPAIDREIGPCTLRLSFASNPPGTGGRIRFWSLQAPVGR